MWAESAHMHQPLRYATFLFVVLAGWNSDLPVLAQAPPRPNVTVANRLPLLNVQVFPADFNKDGRTDLVGSTSGGFANAGTLQVSYGTGTGGLGTPVRIGTIPMVPLGVGDFNNDTRTDVLVYHVQRNNSTGAVITQGVAVLPGTATGFGAPVFVDAPVMPGDFLAAAIADFDRDGSRDFAYAGWDDNVYVFPGNGDLTFDPARSMATGLYSRAAVAADLNNDNLTDLAFTSEYGRQVDVFLNQGGFAFAPSVIPFDRPTLGITAWDINGDGHRDLVVGSGEFHFSANHWEDGFVNVLLGNSTGTFATPVKVPTLPGPVGVVAGDFNRDGRVDIATANQSNQHNAGCDGTGYLFASVSILPGLGNGSFGTPASFALGFDQLNHDLYRTVTALRTNDLNRDGHTDLITAPALTLLNAAPAANRAPTANAGADQQNVFASDLLLRGGATDPDSDWLTYQWTDESGRVVGTQPFSCVREFYNTPQQTFTLTVTDGRGGTASDRMTVTYYNGESENPQPFIYEPRANQKVESGEPFLIRFDGYSPSSVIQRWDLDFSANGGDTWTAIAECTAIPSQYRSCLWRNPSPLTTRGMIRVRAIDGAGRQGFGTSELFSIVTDASGPGGLPAEWTSNDVGAVAAAGSATFSGGTYTVKGSGADIWGTADEFHYLWQQAYRDFSITARVVSLQNVNQWTKAGLMIRSSGWAGSAGYPHASVFATPTTVKGLAFQRRTMQDGTSTSTAGPAVSAPVWLKLTKQGDQIVSYYRKNVTDPWTEIGRATLSIGDYVVAGLAVSSHVDGQVATAVFDNVRVEPLHAFTSTDIGAVGVPGTTRASADGVQMTLEGSGADIWGTADAFRYHYTRFFGDGTITVRVRNVENTNAWAKAGVMFRETTSPGSKHVMAIVSAGKGLALQYRNASGQPSAQAAIKPGTAPEWLRLTRSGNLFTAAHSDDGTTWQTLGSVTVPMAGEVLVGLPVTSHNNATLATAVFDEVTVAP
jgi:regulation of enolase protein 1 (concanavalin A-like superfamily)